MAITGKVEGGGEVGFDLVELGCGGVEPVLDASELAGDALLLAGDEVERDRAAVDSFHQLLPLRGEFRLLAGQLLVFALGVVAAGHQLGPESVLHGVAQRWVEPDGGPVVFDQFLDFGDEQGFAGAGGGLEVSAEADEVGVDDAVAVLGIGDDQSAAAGAAEHAGFEVVRVVALPLTDEMAGQDVLDSLPGEGVDEWRVGALVGHAAVEYLALVVGVGQDGVQHVRFHRARGQLRCPAGGEPSGLQLVGQRPQRPLPGGEDQERPGDQLGAVGVDLDGAFLAAFGGAVSDVAVAEWGLAGGAAGLGFLAHALVDLGGQVAGVELRDRGHDAVQQHPGRGLVDVLRRRHQGRPGLLDGHGDLDVVDAVAGEAVDLVDQHEVGPVLGQVGEHALEVGAVGGSGGFSGVDELIHDHRPEALGFAAVRLSLSRDGEPFSLPSFLGLLLG